MKTNNTNTSKTKHLKPLLFAAFSAATMGLIPNAPAQGFTPQAPAWVPNRYNLSATVQQPVFTNSVDSHELPRTYQIGR